MRRSLTPIAITAATAVVSCGLLALAVWQGWLGPDVGRGATFCEAARDSAVRQPANTFSNLGFVIAGLMIAWHAGKQGTRLDTAFACIVVLLGPGSAAMHATQSAAGGHLDMTSMYVVASFIAAYAAKRFLRTPHWIPLFIGGVAACEIVGLWSAEIPVVMHPGNVAFGLLLTTGVVLEILMMRRPETQANRRYAIASLATLLVAFAIWNATKNWLCDPYSFVQGHAIWHILCAVSAYLIYRYWQGLQSPR